MKFYAENEIGNDIFYVEIVESPGYGNFTDSSLPENIFIFLDVLNLVRFINKCNFNSIRMHQHVEELISILKSKKDFSSFYFQDVELKRNGKYNNEQSNTMRELILDQDIPYLELITIQNNPFLFRFVVREFLTYGTIDHLHISKDLFYTPISENVEYLNDDSEQSSLPVEFKKKELKYAGNITILNVKYQNEIPISFYFSTI